MAFCGRCSTELFFCGFFLIRVRFAEMGGIRVSFSGMGSQKAVAQKTVANRVACTGVGLHSGADIRLALLPASPNSGIVFWRRDLGEQGDPRAMIPARYDHAAETPLCTTIANEHGASVATIEHLMAALAGCEIDNVVVEIDGPEVPAMDGSAEPFVFLIEMAGVMHQAAERRYLRILSDIELTDGERRVSLRPYEGFSLSFDIAFTAGAIGEQSCTLDFTDGTFKTELARARTFCMAGEIEMMKSNGLARGGSLDNAVVVDGDAVINPEGFRLPDECVRHKALDAFGDLYLCGGPIIGAYHGVRSGHALNNRLLRHLMGQEDAWCWVTASQDAAVLAEKMPALSALGTGKLAVH